ncbi:hydroxypyruvate isomerase [Burkholderia oklahomensis]|uniref:Hydroxypyruvate isomerase n=1 Tax=Burkholderia oklahomensis TaxID=342113 RepID=A0AAI8B5M4_9BURK|nr:hydroxypyruvate isomerase [Burkholderia oklahomensis]AIO66146.1 hydroxypyruvate isomerase [Burkholderia oklahomensis]AJX30264.1 hydroxypyruvate isomerase [Burkholderia oklahomensis C6786]AOI42192.1 hydroxypyruvate isomerase [Burkholderia oklahomensis EO147]AOI45771.1 hydroxypyruvate isomerase [Burkholderia oklahomensis C6786]KUY51217.1 hydroxypyruvate isomerase [Burkholderia oklahomensis C6786]
MPKFAANLTMLFNEVPFLDRFKAAADAGFDAVEFLFPYPYQKEELAERLDANRLRLVLHNLPAGNWDQGERGIACLPDRVGEFRDGVGRAIEYAHALKAPQVNCLVGIPSASQKRDTTLVTIVENLRFAAAELKRAGIRLLVEPCNSYDIPGFALNRSADALDVIRAVGSDNLFLQYDIYHMQRMEGELAATIRQHIGSIAHVQLADNPGRHEPGTGEINYAYLFDLLDELGYDGYVGCEYKPRTTTAEGLGWLQRIAHVDAKRARSGA